MSALFIRMLSLLSVNIKQNKLSVFCFMVNSLHSNLWWTHMVGQFTCLLVG